MNCTSVLGADKQIADKIIANATLPRNRMKNVANAISLRKRGSENFENAIWSREQPCKIFEDVMRGLSAAAEFSHMR